MFWGREDVYARRGKNGGYFPQCANRWNDRLCPKQRKEKVLCDEYENKILKDKLKKAGISYEEVNPFEEKIESAEEYDQDQGSRIVNPPYITEKMAIRFFSMFWGREDVYARRGKNGGYFPQCANRWNDRLCPKQRKEKVFCDECENTKWISLDVKKIIAHLLGTKEDGSD